ncbi:MAG: response regulator transcription factor [Bacteroidota bacterium]|nr:response regulator transcription factor [Bacteroidota bacterium]
MSKEKVSILLVDDNKNFVDRMMILLAEIDTISAIHTAFDFDEASLLLHQKPDLVLLDIQLPGGNGMNLLKKIKSSVNQSEVIMLTNHVGEYYRQQCKELGALHFLDKTNDFERLPAMIKDFAGPHRQKTNT